MKKGDCNFFFFKKRNRGVIIKKIDGGGEVGYQNDVEREAQSDQTFG